jgi:hypothetical protein
MGKTRYFRARIYGPEPDDYYGPPSSLCCSEWHKSWQAAQHCGEDHRRLHWLGAGSIRIEEKK